MSPTPRSLRRFSAVESSRNPTMEPVNPAAAIDENQYRAEVLCLPPGESEVTHEQSLVEEARQLGLKVPEIEVTASLAASIASGLVDVSASASSPVLSSGSSTDRNSVCERSPSSRGETYPLDHVASSLSEFTLSSDRVKPGSTRSLASLSTRPTSYSSTEAKPVHDGKQAGNGNGNAAPSESPSSKKEKRRTSLKSAINRIHPRRKRTPSAVLLPPSSQVTVAKGDGGRDKVYVESKPEETPRKSEHNVENEPTKLEVPFYDNDALQRSADTPEMNRMRESQKQERNRHLAFQATALNRLRRQQQASVPDVLAENKRLEDEKREKNATHATRMEERQLAVEMEQEREFERAKMNSRTRIKYMEGYFNNSSPPQTSRPASFSGSDNIPSSRKFTSQNKAQLAQEQHDHDSMDQLHEAKIKVLRDRQEVKLQESIQRLDKELENLIHKHALDFAELQKEHQQEEATLQQSLDAKKMKLRHRWNLEEAVLRKKLETKHGQPFGPLPPLTFSNLHYDTRDSAICVTDNAGTSSGDEEQSHLAQGRLVP